VAATPGADDNGSGMLGLLELARRLSPRTLPIELRLIWFDAEEPGLIGSGAYVKRMQGAERLRLMGVINLETMAYTDRTAGSQRLPPGADLLFDPGTRGDFLLVVGTLGSAPLAKVVGDALADEQGPAFRVEVFSALPAAGWLFPDTRRSDHAHFWDAGHPAVMLTDTANLRNPHYHRATDRVETLDLPFLAAGVRGVERAVLRLAGVEP
jgi:Zn-dependent M28 family amino/carboxypeptidase